MSNRKLMHYFSPSTIPKSDTKDEQIISPEKSGATDTGKVKEVIVGSDNPENDSIFSPQNGNSIRRYFTPVDKNKISLNASKKLCVVTVEAQVHGSPKKKETQLMIPQKSSKKKSKKKKVGIPSSQADVIEVISSEELISESSSSPIQNENVPSEPVVVTKTKWKMKICLGETKSSLSNSDVESNEASDCLRRSARLRSRPIQSPCSESFLEDFEVAIKKKPRSRKRERKESQDQCESDEEVQVILDEVAPIFYKKQRQEEIRAMKKAKQDFLFSGVPEVLKQQTAVQVALEQRPVEIFPKISHVTQTGPDHRKLPYPEELSLLLKPLNLPSLTRPTSFPSNLNSPSENDCDILMTKLTPQTSPLEWRHCKEWICGLKENHNSNFPFFRALRSLMSKSSSGDEDLWTDAYAPTQSIDILGNRKAVNQLKQWLNQWKLRAGEEVPASPKKKSKAKAKSIKRKRLDSDVEEIEDIVEEKSNMGWTSDAGSENQLSSCTLVMGPAGCGKTASIYAVAQELGYNVLEVNASSRRNGKSVLSHLHEATQSHSLNSSSNSVGNNLNKFFGKQAVAKVEEQRTPLSLVLFEDVDIVFETEDESFYSALSTLISTTKRPIILTLGNKHERALAAIQDKVKSYFDVLQFDSPDLQTTCGYLWTMCLVRGYPLEWDSLEQWMVNQGGLDLRSLVLELQMTLEHHPLRARLNFNQLQLKGDEAATTSDDRIMANLSQSQAAPIERIRIVSTKKETDWPPYSRVDKSSRFAYDADQDLVSMTGSKKKRFSRIILDDSLIESDGDDKSEAIPLLNRGERWKGDLGPISRCFDFRASRDLVDSFRSRLNLSCTDANVLSEIQQMMTDLTCKLQAQEIDFAPKQSTPYGELEANQMRIGNQMLLQDSIPRVMALQRCSNHVDVLPFLRSMVRSDLESSLGKRRRKSRSNNCSTIRLPSLDLILPTLNVIDLANAL